MELKKRGSERNIYTMYSSYHPIREIYLVNTKANEYNSIITFLTRLTYKSQTLPRF